ncbi:MAG: ATP-binding cassette domain-containing protein [Rhizobiales bacterium]|nr:ATP-binding cassette domain-containing protein [Hyphomicrobiales bacterium]
MLQVTDLIRAGVGPVSFGLEMGQCLAVTGPSGAGKTLLLRAIADLDPNQGSIHLNSQERRALAAPQWRTKVGLVPAETGWWADTVADHFSRPDDAAQLLEALGVPGDALNWQVQRLSTGERHRLAIARALQLEPDVLLLDEPTAALDKQATRRVETVLRGQLKAGKAIVLVTHDAAQLKRLAHSQIALSGGKASAQEPVG